MAFLGHVAGKAGLREDGDIRRIVRAQIGDDQGREVARSRIFDHGARRLFKTAHGREQVFLILALHRTGDSDDLTLEFPHVAKL